MCRNGVLRIWLGIALALGMTFTPFGSPPPARAEEPPSAFVNVAALNLRAGPGLGYQVLRVLPRSQALSLLGRSLDGLWLEARLPEGQGGWVFGQYVQANTDLSGLPVTEAAGGPAAETAFVNVNALNLRAGPGLEHRVLRVLPRNQALSLLGRSLDGLWVEARLADGSGGWLFAPYVSTGGALPSLPVTEAAGGPDAQPAAPGQFSVLVTIVNDQAVAQLEGYPAQAEVVVSLGRLGQPADLVVARSATDARGARQVTFAMPRQWPDGAPLTENRLTLQVRTVDQTVSQTVPIEYYRFSR